MWPAHLPSPRSYASPAEQYYGEKANLVFQKATAFALSHERAHAVQGHLQIVSQAGASNSLRLELEKEADLSAFASLVSQGLEDDEKAAEAWAVLSAILCSFYVPRNSHTTLSAECHPAMHHRLEYILRSLAFQDERYKYYFPLLCRIVLHTAFPRELLTKMTFEYAQEALDNALDRLDELVQEMNNFQ